MIRAKEGYLLWVNIIPHIAKSSRFTIGTRIENKFLDLLEQTYIAYFTPLERLHNKTRGQTDQNKPHQEDFLMGFSAIDGKIEKVTGCIQLLDLLKYILSVAWEGRIISSSQYEEISRKLDETGRMFGGWLNNLKNPDKKNRTI